MNVTAVTVFKIAVLSRDLYIHNYLQEIILWAKSSVIDLLSNYAAVLVLRALNAGATS